ncbi:MAG: PhoH family protein [Alphaproteobacteria bacterium]
MSKEVVLEFPDNLIIPLLFGEYNRHLSYLEKKLDIEIIDRANILRITGNIEDITKAQMTLQTLHTRLQQGEIQNVTRANIDAELRFLSHEESNSDTPQKTSYDIIKTKRKTVAPRSPNQQKYIELIHENDMVFALGPAGTGKTYLSVATGVDLYLKGEVDRLIFCRPAIEAGENLGFLPGDMKEKIDPYLRPIYDALQDMLPIEFLSKKMEAGEIEIAPLAFMRGRTLTRAFVILDEAQNTTAMQMKMFLTRMGESSHMVITGDPSQSDLPGLSKSGLNDALEILKGTEGIGFINFTDKDVIRHPLVRKIIQAYDKSTKAKSGK